MWCIFYAVFYKQMEELKYFFLQFLYVQLCENLCEVLLFHVLELNTTIPIFAIQLC